jgi:GRF zinc finger protein
MFLNKTIGKKLIQNHLLRLIDYKNITSIMATLNVPWCFCRRASVINVVKNEANPNRGRQYYGCKTGTCKFFQWQDGQPSLKIVREEEEPQEKVVPPWCARLDEMEKCNAAMMTEVGSLLTQLKHFDEHVTYLQREMEKMTERVTAIEHSPALVYDMQPANPQNLNKEQLEKRKVIFP